MWLMPDHAHYQFDPKMIASQNSFSMTQGLKKIVFPYINSILQIYVGACQTKLT